MTQNGEELVVLVDNEDNEIGVLEKMQAHVAGALHRAVSVIVFDSRGRILLQQRALSKYHGAGLWANTACTHPRPGEDPAEAASRRLKQEMGLEADLHPALSFIYRAEFPNRLVEHELDHVFWGRCDDEPQPDPAEVMAVRRIDLATLRRELRARPGDFAPWFHIMFLEVDLGVGWPSPVQVGGSMVDQGAPLEGPH